MARRALTVECVPNFSEGRDPSWVARLGAVIRSCQGVTLHDQSADPDHNRSVFTFTGRPRPVADAAFAAVEMAVEELDLNWHQGVHPRIGVADVVPFVPVSGISMEETVELATEFGDRIWRQLGLPVFLYEEAARRPGRRALERVRRAAREGAEPDIGQGRHRTAGACAVGARGFLIAWNIWLESADVELAQRIATAIRASSGGLPGVKALGLPLESLGIVQVSINSTDFHATPLHVILAEVRAAARHAGVDIRGSELIGMIPRTAIEASAGHDLRWLNLTPGRILDVATHS